MKGSMTTETSRRKFLAGSLALAGTASVPGKVFAQPSSLGPRDRRIFALAREQLERAGSAIWQRDKVGIADFGVHSAVPRFHLAYLEQDRVESFLVTHGTGSDPEHDGWLNSFSNVPESLQTSRGAYVTWEWYHGVFGLSMRLGGLDPTNDNAFPRAIVMHPADYATQGHVDRWGRLGRSNGCFALGPDQFRHCVRELAGGRLLFADQIGIGPDGGQVSPPAPAREVTIPPAQPAPGGVVLPDLD